MRNFGLIGYPLTHSFSKKFFAEKFAREQIDKCSYDLFPIDDISKLPALIEQHQLQGLNVTIPYKKQVIAYVQQLTPTVKQLGACNCIHFVNGMSVGHNTDVAGFEQTFAPHVQSHHTHALVLGTGGASTAVMYVLQKLKIAYTVVSRSSGAGQLTYSDLNNEVMEKHTVVINTTPLGTSPNYHEHPPIPYQYITNRHYLYDLVYNPPKTRFLQLGEERGATIENGERMLIIQAEESWKIWNSLT